MTTRDFFTTKTSVHNAHMMVAGRLAGNNGQFDLEFWNPDKWRTFEITIYTGNDALSAELVEVINATLAKHNRLVGQKEIENV